MEKVLYIGNLLSKHGNTPGVIEILGKKFEELNIDVKYAGYRFNKLGRYIEMISKTIRLGKKVDFVLIDTYSTSAFWFAFSTGMICRILGVRYITILHGGDLPSRLERSKLYTRLLFNGAYQNVAVSNYLHVAFSKFNFKSIVIPNIIDISEYRYLKRDEISPKLLWVRSFHRDYNPKLAIDVLQILSQRYPGCQLCMVGPDKDGSMQEVKDYAEKMNLNDKLNITGRLSKSEWHKLSEDYDIFINTTNFDNTPVSVIEAMALGIPIVSTNVGGIPFLLEDLKDAILCEPRNDKDMADKIQILLDNNKLSNDLTYNARKKAESFDWENVKYHWLKLLKA